MTSSRMHAWWVGIATSLFAVILYAPATGRGLGYDEAVTVGNFVATPSLIDPVRRQVGYNNHVLFSFFEHVVYSVRGGWSALSMRILPMAFAVAAVAIVAVALTRRFGPLAGLSGGVALAANPAFALEATTIRGYSLVVLTSVVSTILLLSLLQTPDESRWNTRSVGYVIAVAAGLATHLFTVLVVLGHLTLVASRRRLTPTWRARWIAAAVLGGLAYAGVARQMAIRAGGGRFFRRGLPNQLPGFFFGRPVVAAILVAAVVAFGALLHLRRVETKILTLVYVTAFVVVWLVIRPQFLYVRFFLWALPAVACAIAAAVSRRPALALLVGVAVVVQVAAQIPHRRDEQAPIRLAGSVVTTTVASGGRACADTETAYALVAETRAFKTIVRADQLAECDLVVLLLPSARVPVIAEARTRYPFSYELPAIAPGLVVSRAPIGCKTERPKDRPTIVSC